MNQTDMRRIELERELYDILSELWDTRVETSIYGVRTGSQTLHASDDMAKRIKDALGIKDET
jgi:hypothetical protein